mmetsp:Transcript_115326/g.290235  ORF Transcript_115326/g.290235 Transcript_115326/m.290235 type:complete len:124 (-) Transcript_115326:68-439(-)
MEVPASGAGHVWAGRAGKESGSLYMVHSVAQSTNLRSFTTRQVNGIHGGSAGAACGASYEVVPKGCSSKYMRTAPFANDSAEWRHSTGKFASGHFGSADQASRREFQGTLHRAASIVLQHANG